MCIALGISKQPITHLFISSSTYRNLWCVLTRCHVVCWSECSKLNKNISCLLEAYSLVRQADKCWKVYYDLRCSPTGISLITYYRKHRRKTWNPFLEDRSGRWHFQSDVSFITIKNKVYVTSELKICCFLVQLCDILL